MKKAILCFLLTFVLSGFLSSAYARETETIIISQNEVIDSDLIKVGESILLSGTVNGDAYLMGALVNFDGKVTGDLIIIGGKVTVSGQIDQSLRVIGGDIVVNGLVGKNLSALGGNINISKIAVPGSLVAIAGNLESKANFGQGGKLAVGRGLFNGSFGKDVKIAGSDELIFGPDLKVQGKLVYGSPKQAKIDTNAKIIGGVTYDKNLQFLPENIKKAARPFQNDKVSRIVKSIRSSLGLVSLIFTLVVGNTLLYFWPKKGTKLMLILEKNPAQSFLWGVLILSLTPFIVLFLFATILGIPFAILYIFLLGILIFLSKIIGSLAVGRKALLILGARERRGWALFIGLLIYYLISFIPLLGFIYKILLLTTSLGVFIIYLRSQKVAESPR